MLWKTGLVMLAAFASFTGGVFGQDEKKDGPFLLVNPAKDIRVLAEKKGSTQDFFQNHHILVAGLVVKEYKKVRAADKVREKMMFSGYASYNDNDEKASLFAATVNLAPTTKAARDLIDAHLNDADGKERFLIVAILRRDAKDPELYHLVGVTERTAVGFFDRKDKKDPDDFTQRELKFKGK